MRTLRMFLFIVATVLALATPLEARLYSPRVVSPHVADAHSMASFSEFPRWRNLSGDQLAREVFQYLTDERTGLFPLGQPVREGRDVLEEYLQVRDPVKLMNVYGYGYCGILGPTMAGVCEQMGIGPSRTLVLPGWNHVVGETFYNDGWHYLDLDVRAIFRRPDGRLAAMAEAQHDDALWRQPDRRLFFPLDQLEKVREAYRTTPVHSYYGHHHSGHTMDYVLRQGETFTRWWTPQGGRWLHHAGYHEDEYFRRLFEREPRGPKCKHAGWTIHSYGNGRFVYRPDLTSRSTDFEDGVYDFENVEVTSEGLSLQQPGRGFAIFEVRSPYVIVPRVGDMRMTSDDREASMVNVVGEHTSLSISLDNGLSWSELPLGRDEYDLTSYVRCSYGYLLKLTLDGRLGEAVVRRLETTTWVQLAPASLPALRRGVNRIEFRTGDQYALPTRVTEVRPNANDRADLVKYLTEAPADFDPGRATARVKGTMVVQVQAPPRAKIAWFSAGGNFNVHQGESAGQTRNRMAYAVDEPRDFVEFYKAEVPIGQAHWHYNADRIVKLDSTARKLYLRYTGDPGVNNVRIYAHSVDDRPATQSPVVITHAWTENGAVKTHRVTMDRPGAYEVTAQGDPANVSIELSVASQAQPK